MPIYRQRWLGFYALSLGQLTGCAAPSAVTTMELEQRADARITLGLAYLAQSQRVKAWENLTLAVGYAPNYHRAQLALAHYYEQVDDAAKAQALYEQALRQHPQNGDLMNNYGAFLCKQHQYHKADQWFHQARQQPGYTQLATSYENAGLCALKAQQTAAARAYFEQAIAHDPHLTQAWQQLIGLDLKDQAYAKAKHHLADFQRYLGHSPASMDFAAQINALQPRTAP